jgi:hypothetical protein
MEQQCNASEFDVDAVRLLIGTVPGRDHGLVCVTERIVDGNVQCATSL